MGCGRFVSFERLQQPAFDIMTGQQVRQDGFARFQAVPEAGKEYLGSGIQRRQRAVVSSTKAVRGEILWSQRLCFACFEPRKSRGSEITVPATYYDPSLADQMLAGDWRFAISQLLHVTAFKCRTGRAGSKVKP